MFGDYAPGTQALAGYSLWQCQEFVHAGVPAGGEHVRGCGGGSMVIIWAGNLSWELIEDVWKSVFQSLSTGRRNVDQGSRGLKTSWNSQDLPRYGGLDLVGDSALEIPCLRGSRQRFVSLEGTSMAEVPVGARVPGGRRNNWQVH